MGSWSTISKSLADKITASSIYDDDVDIVSYKQTLGDDEITGLESIVFSKTMAESEQDGRRASEIITCTLPREAIEACGQTIEVGGLVTFQGVTYAIIEVRNGKTYNTPRVVAENNSPMTRSRSVVGR